MIYAIKLKSGRHISIDYLTISGTYSGMYEGGYEKANEHILSRENLKLSAPDSCDLCTRIIRPANMAKRMAKALPRLILQGTFSSDPLVNNPRLDDNSLLKIIWFQDKIEPLINAESKRQFDLQIDWDKYAIDCPMF